MRRTPMILGIALVALAVAVVACTPGPQATASPAGEGDVSIVGTWNCVATDGAEQEWEIIADGTVTITSIPDGFDLGSLTWTVEGDRVSFQGPPNEAPDVGTIESEDRIVFESGALGSGAVCTRAE
jgi:hypothetical protein